MDFQHVKAGDLLIEIDRRKYLVAVQKAQAAVSAAESILDNLTSQIDLQQAAIDRADAEQQSASAHELQTRLEEQRQKLLITSNSGTQQKLEQAVADHARAYANLRASKASASIQRHQLDVLKGMKLQRAAELAGTQAALAAAKLELSYTRIVSPFDGIVSRRQVQPGDYVRVGSSLINVVPIPTVYVIANYKETQLTNIEAGQLVDISVDTFPAGKLHGRVAAIAPASGSQFALLPPDNATGNFTKVVERIPVRIEFEKGQSLVSHLLPGMSVITRIHIRRDSKSGTKKLAEKTDAGE
jgi:membrane fusion protein (multidrug efflux system)